MNHKADTYVPVTPRKTNHCCHQLFTVGGSVAGSRHTAGPDLTRSQDAARGAPCANIPLEYSGRRIRNKQTTQKKLYIILAEPG